MRRSIHKENMPADGTALDDAKLLYRQQVATITLIGVVTDVDPGIGTGGDPYISFQQYIVANMYFGTLPQKEQSRIACP